MASRCWGIFKIKNVPRELTLLSLTEHASKIADSRERLFGAVAFLKRRKSNEGSKPTMNYQLPSVSGRTGKF
jgi:hypothetical protein